ncbi:hypothetical protein H1C71_012034 [Ictidomys tridecemlineatus]|nr:hypothetical protein H1C71_012034 [Ictidomys tridecemlineatus]
METSALLTGQAQGPPTDAHPPFPPGVEGLHLEGPPLEDCPRSVTGEGREEGAAAWAGPLHVWCCWPGPPSPPPQTPWPIRLVSHLSDQKLKLSEEPQLVQGGDWLLQRTRETLWLAEK